MLVRQSANDLHCKYVLLQAYFPNFEVGQMWDIEKNKYICTRNCSSAP